MQSDLVCTTCSPIFHPMALTPRHWLVTQFLVHGTIKKFPSLYTVMNLFYLQVHCIFLSFLVSELHYTALYPTCIYTLDVKGKSVSNKKGNLALHALPWPLHCIPVCMRKNFAQKRKGGKKALVYNLLIWHESLFSWIFACYVLK